ncbi:RlpA-like double-psi beta-barrel-protein domain-containing protein-containing protein, partial [Mycena galopus ATCC 62051]
ATYYYPNGGTGACGGTIQNGDMAVAIGQDNWDNGAHCGATMTVTYGGTTIYVTVEDLCPGCQGSNGIDLTQGAFAAMDPNWANDGVDTVTWSTNY